MKCILAALALAISSATYASTNCELDIEEAFATDSKGAEEINGISYSATKNCEARFHGGETIIHSANLKYREDWLVSCSIDPISDVKKCMLHRSSVSLFMQSDGLVTIKIGSDVYPSSDAFIRIDNDIPLSSKEGYFHGDTALSIIGRLSKGTKVTIKYYKWPSYTGIINSIELTGFKEAVQFMEWAIPRMTTPH